MSDNDQFLEEVNKPLCLEYHQIFMVNHDSKIVIVTQHVIELFRFHLADITCYLLHFIRLKMVELLSELFDYLEKVIGIFS